MSYTINTKTITPEQAREWLDTAPEHQRKINSAYAQRLADSILSGTFTQSPQPFIIDTNGDLLDGQHRATAICIAGSPLESAVVIEGVDPSLFGVIDIGLRRHASQFVRHPHASAITSAARLIMVYRTNPEMWDLHKATTRLTTADIVEEVESNPLLSMWAGSVMLIRNATKIFPGALLAITALGALSNADLVDDWLTGLNTGADLKIGDPRLTLREAFIVRHAVLQRDPRRRWALIVKAWNAYVTGNDLRVLKYRVATPSDVGEAMPAVL